MYPGPMPDYMGWMMFGSYAFWAIAIALAVYFGVRVTRSPGPSSTARSILEDRLARGEINEDEFRSRLATLKG